MNMLVNPSSLVSTAVSALGGVWGHSSPSHWDTYVVFCVGNDLVKEAAFRQWAHASNIGFKSLVGCYKGQTENSFIVNHKHFREVLPWIKREESVLILGANENMGGGKSMRPAKLVFLEDNTEQDLGYFREVGREYALAQDAWTYDPQTCKYWVCA